MEFVGKTWDECLKPLYVVFFSCHTSRISPQAFVALWLYSVITTGYGVEESEKRGIQDQVQDQELDQELDQEQEQEQDQD